VVFQIKINHIKAFKDFWKRHTTPIKFFQKKKKKKKKALTSSGGFQKSKFFLKNTTTPKFLMKTASYRKQIFSVEDVWVVEIF